MGKKGMMAKRDIVKFDFHTGRKTVESQMFAVEKPMKVYVNGEYFSTFFVSPEMEKELVIGHMLSQGIIKSVNDIERVQVLDERGVYAELREGLRMPRVEAKVYVSATAGFTDFSEVLSKIQTSPTPSDLRVEVENFGRMVEILEEKDITYKTSKGCHLAAIFTKNADLISFSEDVGRHNAVDKVVGAAALRRMDFSRLVLLSSGRQSAHMVLKAVRVSIPIIVTLADPLESGLEVAEKAGITLIHFKERFLKVFTFPERIRWL